MENERTKETGHRKYDKQRRRKTKVSAAQIKLNADALVEEKKWIERLIETRLIELQDKESESAALAALPPPALTEQKDVWYSTLIHELGLNDADRVLMMCALLPHISASTFTKPLRQKDSLYAVAYTEFGGVIEQSSKNFLPSLQTALFLIAGKDESEQLKHYLDFFNSALLCEHILQLRSASGVENEGNDFGHLLIMAPEYVNYLISGEKPRLDFGKTFPADLVHTDLDWESLVVKDTTRKQIDDVVKWLNVSGQMNDTPGIKKGFPCLFYGPPGTGKTLAATLIGRYTGKDVFRIDLSMIVSKYIGETEKNLAHLFERAENKDCILFFDEADALFTKRTGVSNANDKWANLEVSYLLQRMETYPGLTILASNLKDNIDTAMTRRFQSIIYFGRPKTAERLELWKKALPQGFVYSPILSFEKLAQHDMTGANIANIIKYCCTQALYRGQNSIEPQDVLTALGREYSKENRTQDKIR